MSAAVWDDDLPVDRHHPDCPIWNSDDACDPIVCGADDEDPADRFGDGYADTRGGYPLDDPLGRLLLPDTGTLADRLEQLARALPRSGGGDAA